MVKKQAASESVHCYQFNKTILDTCRKNWMIYQPFVNVFMLLLHFVQEKYSNLFPIIT